ncbi:hypothetical protein [Levilactobacillus cerevisiae]
MMTERVNEKSKIMVKDQQSQVDLVLDHGAVRLVYLGALRDNAEWLRAIDDQLAAFKLSEIQVTGENIHHKGIKQLGTGLADRLQYVAHQVDKMANG